MANPAEERGSSTTFRRDVETAGANLKKEAETAAGRGPLAQPASTVAISGRQLIGVFKELAMKHSRCASSWRAVARPRSAPAGRR